MINSNPVIREINDRMKPTVQDLLVQMPEITAVLPDFFKNYDISDTLAWRAVHNAQTTSSSEVSYVSPPTTITLIKACANFVIYYKSYPLLTVETEFKNHLVNLTNHYHILSSLHVNACINHHCLRTNCLCPTDHTITHTLFENSMLNNELIMAKLREADTAAMQQEGKQQKLSQADVSTMISGFHKQLGGNKRNLTAKIHGILKENPSYNEDQLFQAVMKAL